MLTMLADAMMPEASSMAAGWWAYSP